MQTLALTHGTNASYLTESRLSAKHLVLIAFAHLGLLALLSILKTVPTTPLAAALMIDVLEAVSPAAELAPTPAPTKPALHKAPPKNLPMSAPKAVLSTQGDATRSTDIAQFSEATFAQATPAVAPTTSPPRFDADYLKNPAPTYPPLSRRLHEEGALVLRVWVEPTGRPGQIEVKTSSGSPRLDHAAQEAVWRWHFLPARHGNEVVGAWVLVPITFVLKA